MNTPETEIYQGSNVRVTNQRVVVDSTTYAVRNVTSVRAQTTPPNRRWAVIFLLVGAGLTLTGGMLVYDVVTDVSASVFGLGIACLAIGVLLWRLGKTIHAAVTTTSAGEVPVLESEDAEEVRQIVDAINTAIIQHSA